MKRHKADVPIEEQTCQILPIEADSNEIRSLETIKVNAPIPEIVFIRESKINKILS